MHISLLTLLACPSCRCAYEAEILGARGDTITSGILACPRCGIAVPLVEGFPLFGEARPMGNQENEPWLRQLKEKHFDLGAEYQAFLREKMLRRNSDSYAAFQPFNESSRSIYPFLPLLKEGLRPGDVILDTWCRTGWSGELLAGLFPEQRIISIWEGNNNVLGYRGFAHWLAEGKRAPNLDIIFTHPDQALPLADGCVRIVHGLDSLHRYRHASFIPECLRVCAEDGVLVFPHIHLSNSEPDPFFERGCFHYHGREWKSWLDRTLAGTSRSGWVLSEAALFEADRQFQLCDQSDTSHYNGLALVADSRHEARALGPRSFPALSARDRLILNPLLDINLHLCEVAFDPATLAGRAEDMMSRHPCYEKKLNASIGNRLAADEARLLWHAQQGLDLKAISHAMQLPLLSVMEIAEGLCARELIHPAAVSASMATLQDFYATVKLPAPKPATFGELWLTSMGSYQQRPVLHWLEDDSQLGVDEVIYLVDAIQIRLLQEGLGAGSRILIACAHHPEALLLCWAAWLQGMVTVVVDESLPMGQIERACKRSEAALLFTDQVSVAQNVSTRAIVLDGATVPPDTSFSSWLEDSLGSPPPQVELEPDQDAAVLFTSGSTGESKGVVLSQRALCNSGVNMARTHGWNKEVLLSLGPLSMMSGLRNPAVAALASSSTVLVPARKTLQAPLNSWLQACSRSATVVTAVPAWLKGLMSVMDRLDPAPSLRQILLTGTNLDARQQFEAKDRLGLTIGNYYGLTETGGICTAALDEVDFGTLGRPANALLQILDPHGQPVKRGETGLLRVHSDQLMSRYLDNDQATRQALQQGWLLTGDLAHWDAEGRLVLDGREDELLKLRNGARFHPLELESVLGGFPEVDSAAVLLVGEQCRLVALVVTTSHPGDIRKQLIAVVAPHLVPDQILAVVELPTNSNGKLVRARLAELVEQFDLPR